MRRTGSRSAARSQLPDSLAEAQLVDAELRKHSLVPFEAEGVNDGVHCFFHAVLDALEQAGYHPEQDMQQLRKDVKLCLIASYPALLDNGTIAAWLNANTDIKNKVQTAGSARAQATAKLHEWKKYCNVYALSGYATIRARPDDELTCQAVADLFQCVLRVHTKFGTRPFVPRNGASIANVHLAWYCTAEWQHYRSTRPLQVNPPPALPVAGPVENRSAPPSPGPASGATDVPRTAEEAAPRTVPDNGAASAGAITGDVSMPVDEAAQGTAPGNGAAAAASQLANAPEDANARRSVTREYVATAYVARDHPATNEVILRHIETVERLHREGISRDEDRDAMLDGMVL